MTLSPRSRLGSYEIHSALGAGGMGEVYRARDTKLGRDVALKILPDAFANDPERLARFEREAQPLASLNHPNIAAIDGVEDSTATKALVIELVDGPTLADRIAQGPLPIDEALTIAKQMAEALEAAHDQGIIHRDLKPANIKLRPDGTAKVPDFGIAKAFEKTPLAGDLTQSPTMLSPAPTLAGVILGTATYMSHEQAPGEGRGHAHRRVGVRVRAVRNVDGTKPFDGETPTDVVAAIVKNEPDWAAWIAAVLFLGAAVFFAARPSINSSTGDPMTIRSISGGGS